MHGSYSASVESEKRPAKLSSGKRNSVNTSELMRVGARKQILHQTRDCRVETKGKLSVQNRLKLTGPFPPITKYAE